MKLKTFIGIAVIAFGVVSEVMWLGVCFGTVVVGILLLIFAPGILFLPFNFFLTLGLSIIGLQTYKTNFRYHEQYHHQYRQQNADTQVYSFDDMDKYYEVLESKKSDSLEVIKANYRRLIKKYHYDSIASKDLPEEMVQFAKEKTQSLNEAYAKIKELRKNGSV